MSEHKKSGSGIVTALVAGVFGALAGAAAVFFSDKENRTKVHKGVNQLVKEGKKKLTEVQSRVEDMSADAKRQLADELEKTSRKLGK